MKQCLLILVCNMDKILNQLYFKLLYKELNSLDCWYEIEDKIPNKYEFINNQWVMKEEIETLIKKFTFLTIENKIKKRLLKIIRSI